MALSYVNSSSNKSTTTSVSITKPTNVADGDILIAFVSAYRATNRTAGTVTAPSGWNTINTQAISTRYQVGLFWKRASSEGSSYSFTSSSATQMQGAISAYRGAITSGNPYSIYSNTLYGTSNTTVRAASMTPSANGLYVVWGGWYYLAGTISLSGPSGMTQLQNQNNTRNALTMSHAVFTPGSATGDQDGTAGANCTVKHAYMVELLAASDTITQTAAARIQIIVEKNQTASSRISRNESATQTATASIHVPGVSFASQSAVARIQLTGLTSQQTATARIGRVESITQTATARIVANTPPGQPILNSPDNYGFVSTSGLPTLNFTVSDYDLNQLECNLQIDTVDTFDSQSGNPLYSFYSDSDPGFTSGHPYNSGSSVDYTAQSALTADTYYWRVAAIDPNGSNTYSAWSETRCFIVPIQPEITYRATGAYNSSGSTTAVIPAPSGLANGDLIFAVIRRAAAVNPSNVPTGWNIAQSVLSTYGFWVYYKIANNEGSSWTWTWAASSKTLGRSHAFYGSIDTANPIQNSTTPFSNNASGTPIDIPSLTTSADDTYSILIPSAYSTSTKTFTVPTSPSYTEHNDSGSTSPDFWQAIASYRYQASGTTTGVISYPLSANSTYRVGCQIFVNTIPYNYPPYVDLNTPSDDSEISDHTPTLNFTGTDLESDNIEYNVQIDTINTFDSQSGSPLISVFSESDSGFSDSHPYSSGSAVDYTVQTSLSTTTYYWRVAAIDPLGNNSYGEWSDTYSFTITENYSPTVDLNLPNDMATEQPTTPVLEFTGTDPENNDLEYEVQIDTVDTFNSVSGQPLLDKKSETDTGFTSGHPFDSGSQVSFTVQSADELTESTQYYWRARATDPLGSDTYGSWSITRSFYVGNMPPSTSSVLPVEAQLVSATPTFSFVGYDVEDDAIEYNVQIDTVDTFDSQSGNPLYSFYSESDSGFTSGHPYDSGNQVEYTVQSSLSLGTFYWRVAGIDPLGKNSYGDWTEARSFTVVDNAPPYVLLNYPNDGAQGVPPDATLIFTGTDPEGDDIEYHIQVDTTDTFNSNGGGSPTIGFTDSFESATWTSVLVSGSGAAWTRVTSSSRPSGITAQNGTYFARFNSYTCQAGASARYYTSTTTTINSGAGSARLTFWMYHDTGYNTNDDRVQLQVSINSGSSWVNVGSAVSRYNGATGWAKATIDVSNYIGVANIMIGFLGISAYGNDCHIDNIAIEYDLPSINRYSASDTGFTSGHPYTSGDTIQYDIQSGEILTKGTTYYWRARAIDPLGINSYGSWSTTNSFVPNTGIKTWTGSEWIYQPIKIWSGSNWVEKHIKYWDGTQWIIKG